MTKILVADDEPHMRTLVTATLDDARFEIIQASDGTSALDLVRRERPDLLVLDWMMPGMTGLEVATTVRDDPALATLPIIFLTAKGQETDRQRGEAVGVVAYLVKPFSPLELLEVVEKALA